MTSAKQNSAKIKLQNDKCAKKRKVQWGKYVNALVKLLPLFTKLISTLMPLIILLLTHYWQF